MPDPGTRSGTGVLSTLTSTPANIFIKDANFESLKRQIPTHDLSVTLKHANIENQASKQADLAPHEDGVGLSFTDSEISHAVYAEGLGATYGNGDTALGNALIDSLASCLGGAPVFSTGSLINDGGGAHTTTSVIESTSIGAHGAKQFLALQDANGKIHLRPILTYGAGGEMGLGFALPAIPTDGKIAYGIPTVLMDEVVNVLLQGDILKRNTLNPLKAAQNYEFFGGAGTFSIAEAAVNEAFKIQFKHRVATHTRYNAKARTAPLSGRPLALAGGEFLLGKYGNTTPTYLRFANYGIELGRTYVADPDANSDFGLGGWIVNAQDTVITLYVHDDQAMPAGFTATNFHEAWRMGGDQNLWHLQLASGQRWLQRVFGLYFPALRLAMEPEDADMGEIQCIKLTFKLVSQLGGISKIWACCA
jgi:hypothetical protein